MTCSSEFHPQNYCVIGMASNISSSSSERFSKEQDKKSGRETEEYKNVQQNMEKIERAINALPGALKNLSRQFMTHEWFDAQTDQKDITTFNLIQIALIRIENDASHYNQFIKMLKSITGLDHIMPSLNVKKEELVSGKTDRSPTLIHSPKVKKKVTQLEPDSGYAVEHTPPSPRKLSPPPGTIPNPLEIASGFVPEASLQSHSSGESSQEFTGMPVPSSTAESANVEVHQPRYDVADYQPPGAMFRVGSGSCRERNSSGVTPQTGTENEFSDNVSQSVQEISKKEQSEKEAKAVTAIYLGTGTINEQQREQLKSEEQQKLQKKLEEQQRLQVELDKQKMVEEEHRQQIQDLKQKLKDETNEKIKITSERDQLRDRLQQLQEYTKEKIKEKTQELQEVEKEKDKIESDYKKLLADAEREKVELQLEHRETVKRLEKEINQLKEEISNQEKESKIETLRLTNQIKDNEIVILKQKNKISELDKKIKLAEAQKITASKDAKIQELTKKLSQEKGLGSKPYPPHFTFKDT